MSDDWGRWKADEEQVDALLLYQNDMANRCFGEPPIETVDEYSLSPLMGLGGYPKRVILYAAEQRPRKTVFRSALDAARSALAESAAQSQLVFFQHQVDDRVEEIAQSLEEKIDQIVRERVEAVLAQREEADRRSDDALEAFLS